MAIYEFKRQDGEIVEKSFPMGECPSEITCEDGTLAKRVFSSSVAITFREGHETSSKLKQMNESMRKKNLAAGERGRKSWRERMPKLKS